MFQCGEYLTKYKEKSFLTPVQLGLRRMSAVNGRKIQ